MKHLARTLLAAGLLAAAFCACLPPHVPGPASPVAATPALQGARPTPSPRPSATAPLTPSATALPAAGRTTPAPEPAAFGLVAIPRATVVYYDVVGDTADELRAQLDALGPVGSDGERWDAVCNWDYWWSWPAAPGGGCDLAAATVTYEVRVTFPRWSPPAGAPPDLVARWTGFVQALAAHELGHVDRAIAGVAWVEEALRGADCDTANAAAEEAVARVQEENDAYDAATGHGMEQGVRFP